MKILMLAPEFLPAWGGVGVYIYEITKNMPRNVEIHILTPNRTRFKDNDLKNYEEITHQFSPNIHLHHLGTAKDNFFYNFSFQINCIKNVPRLIKEYGIDIIHSESAMPDLFLNPEKVKIPIITTVHTTIEGQLNTIRNTNSSFKEFESSEKFTYLLGPFLKAMENSYYRKKRHFITVSQWGKDTFQKYQNIPSDKVRVIYNGVDSSIFTPENSKYSDIYFPDLADITTLKILFLSRLTNSKGINNLIKAIPKVIRTIDAHFIIAGAGKRIFIDNSFKKNYSYLGYVSHEKTPFLYPSTDIFILPSFSENFPLSVLESMASQNAVIASNVGGIPEMIQTNQNGLLIPPGDPDSIAHGLIELGENISFREKLSRNARNSVIEKFNWKNASLETKKYYEEVLQN